MERANDDSPVHRVPPPVRRSRNLFRVSRNLGGDVLFLKNPVVDYHVNDAKTVSFSGNALIETKGI